MKLSSICYFIVLACCLAIGIGRGVTLRGQAEAPQGNYLVRQWQAAWLPGIDNRLTDDDPSHRFRLDVIDTVGVCLYVVQGYHRVSDGISNPTTAIGMTAIAAVPKTALKSGVGCQ